jgi:hypothetical protein
MSAPAEKPRFWSPIWRSRRSGHRQIRLVRFLVIAALTLVVPALLAFVLAGPFVAIGEVSDEVFNGGEIGGLAGLVATMMFLTVFSPIYGVVLVPVAMALLAVAMRFGRAGLGVAGLAAIGIGFLVGGMFSAADDGVSHLFAIFTVPIALLHGAVLWGLTRWLLPETLLPEAR